MPIPTPRKQETQDAFMNRCMSSDVMRSEFPKNSRRVAVCMQKWEDKNKKKDSSASDEVEKLVEAFLERHPELKSEE